MLLIILVLLAGGCAGFDEESVQSVEAGWRLVSSDPASEVLEIVVVVGSGCRQLHDVRVAERPERVEIAALVVEQQGSCTADCNQERATVTLRSPLGSRRVDEPEGLPRRC